MAKHFNGYDNWKQDRFECPECGWAGFGRDLSEEYYDQLYDGSCPKCDKILAIISYPSIGLTKKLAAEGHPEALTELDFALQREAFLERLEARDSTQPRFPRLWGIRLKFVWDFETEKVDGDHHWVVRCGDRLVWREIAAYGDWRRFNEIKALLKNKYGWRFVSLTPTEASKLYLYGDDLRAAQEISLT